MDRRAAGELTGIDAEPGCAYNRGLKLESSLRSTEPERGARVQRQDCQGIGRSHLSGRPHQALDQIGCRSDRMVELI